MPILRLRSTKAPQETNRNELSDSSTPLSFPGRGAVSAEALAVCDVPLKLADTVSPDGVAPSAGLAVSAAVSGAVCDLSGSGDQWMVSAASDCAADGV